MDHWASSQQNQQPINLTENLLQQLVPRHIDFQKETMTTLTDKRGISSEDHLLQLK